VPVNLYLRVFIPTRARVVQCTQMTINSLIVAAIRGFLLLGCAAPIDTWRILFFRCLFVNCFALAVHSKPLTNIGYR
jgi:hypothetical protein